MSIDRSINAIYTDGACSGNPGPGGWGVVVYCQDGAVHELGGGEKPTTNNRMELQGAIAALEFLTTHPQAEPVTLYTDSEYVMKGITQWIHGWKKKGWKTSTGKAVVNQDLWQVLDRLHTSVQSNASLKWEYVRGHSGNQGNDRCDAIARAYAVGRVPALQQIRWDEPVPMAATSSSAPSSQDPHKNAVDSSLLSDVTDTPGIGTVQSNLIATEPPERTDMMDTTAHSIFDTSDEVPREVRLAQIRHMVETLRIADEVATHGFLITSAELADLMDVNASAVTSRGDNWVWRNWVVSRVRREGNQILWQLERVD